MHSHDMGLLPDTKGKRVFMIGDEPPMRLLRSYDPDQLWLPFTRGLFFIADEEEPSKTPRKLQQDKTHKTYARMPPECRHFYVYEAGVPQYVLPFAEARRLSNKEFKRMCTHDAPTWDRNRAGDLCFTPFRNRTYAEPAEWCRENLRGRFHCNASGITCELEIDAVQAALVFG